MIGTHLLFLVRRRMRPPLLTTTIRLMSSPLRPPPLLPHAAARMSIRLGWTDWAVNPELMNRIANNPVMKKSIGAHVPASAMTFNWMLRELADPAADKGHILRSHERHHDGKPYTDVFIIPDTTATGWPYPHRMLKIVTFPKDQADNWENVKLVEAAIDSEIVLHQKIRSTKVAELHKYLILTSHSHEREHRLCLFSEWMESGVSLYHVRSAALR